MHTKLPLALAVVVLLLSANAAVASATVSLGVKKTDWIEYEVAFAGDSSFGHDVVWARIDVTDVLGNAFTLNITTKSSSGALSVMTSGFNLETGELGDDFIIPANMDKWDTFFSKGQGNITITGVERRTLVGAERTVLSANTADSTYYWDKLTGVTVEANSTYPTYTITTKATATNLWRPQIFSLDPALFLFITCMAIAAVAALVIRALNWRRTSLRGKPVQPCLVDHRQMRLASKCEQKHQRKIGLDSPADAS